VLNVAPETVLHDPQYIYSFFPHKGVLDGAVSWETALQSECRRFDFRCGDWDFPL